MFYRDHSQTKPVWCSYSGIKLTCLVFFILALNQPISAQIANKGSIVYFGVPIKTPFQFGEID